MRSFCFLLVLTLSLAACSGDEQAPVRPEPAKASPPAALVVRGGRLAEIDARTLEPLPGRAVHLGGHNGDIAMSPDGSRVAVGGWKSVRIVDLARFEVVADLPKPHGYSRAVSWGQRGRIVVVSEVYRRNRVEVLVFETDSGRLLARRPFAAQDGSFFAAEVAHGTVAFLLQPFAGIGPTRLVYTDAQGRPRLIGLERIVSGIEYLGGTPAARVIWPALTLDADGGRAYVAGAGDLVADVDLQRRRVEYHELIPALSLAARVRNWLEPTAEAKLSDGIQLGALWLGEGRLALYGYRTTAVADGEVREALGFRLVDTAIWSVSMVDDEVVSLDRSGELVLAWSDLWDGGIGLRAYGLSGDELFHMLGERPVETVSIVGSQALVKLPDGKRTVAVDLRGGRVVGLVESALIPARVVP